MLRDEELTVWNSLPDEYSGSEWSGTVVCRAGMLFMCAFSLLCVLCGKILRVSRNARSKIGSKLAFVAAGWLFHRGSEASRDDGSHFASKKIVHVLM
jgi:hypothetical protein